MRWARLLRGVATEAQALLLRLKLQSVCHREDFKCCKILSTRYVTHSNALDAALHR